MIIGIPREIKEDEYRVSLTPNGTKILVESGHKIFVEKSAGNESGFSDGDYKNSGAEISENAADIWQKSEMIVKVKEPRENEFKFFRENLILFTYLHLAASPELTKILQEKNVIAIDYSTIELPDESLPLLAPMSEIAGKLAAQKGAQYLEKIYAGKGILLGGAKNALPANVLILGGGTVGFNAAKIALGLGAKVTILDRNQEKCESLKKQFQMFGDKFECLISSQDLLKNLMPATDLLIGAVLVPGAKAPKVISEEMVKTMKPGSVIVDVAIDQGGCVETSRPTTHKEPVFVKHRVIHYCVANMPGIVPQTSTFALTQATLPYILEISNKGFQKAIKENQALAKGINVYQGKITNLKLSEALNEKYFPIENLI